MDRCRHRKLVNDFNMKSLGLFWTVTLLSIGLSERRNLYGPAKYGDRPLARE
jgi:hypothetical protein